jgi:flagellar hook-associated protein 1 FlgK
MTLSIGLEAARSGLSVVSEQIALVSRNVSRANDPDSTRKTVQLVSGMGGSVRLSTVQRTANVQLLESLLNANSDASSQKAIVDALSNIDTTIGDSSSQGSPAALISKLNSSLQLYADNPSDTATARAVVAAASSLVTALNDASGTTQKVRNDADAAIASSVSNVNDLLAKFKTVNNSIIRDSQSGADISDQLDARDALLKEISSEIGIRTSTRAENDMVIYTDSGIALFETTPRTVTFQPSTLSPGSTGNSVYIDGVPAAGGTEAMPISSGRIRGLITVRDSIAPTYQAQLDEMARGLVETFSESDQTGGGAPRIAGLFTYSGGPGVPASGVLVSGMASKIKINPNVDPAQGGLLTRLRDGGAGAPGNPAYVYNTANSAGFSNRINQLIDGLSATRNFSAAAGTDTSASLTNFASSSVSWIGDNYTTASARLQAKTTMRDSAATALSSGTGVNLDEEMAHMLELERSYQASSRLISTIDQMMQVLLSELK